jgi:hypothetical protein
VISLFWKEVLNRGAKDGSQSRPHIEGQPQKPALSLAQALLADASEPGEF